MRQVKKVIGLGIFLSSFSAALYGQAQPVLKLDKPLKTVVIDSVAHALLRYYVYPDLAAAIGSHLKDQLKKGVYDTIKNPNRFAQSISQDLLAIHTDKHLSIRYDPELEKRINAFNQVAEITRTANQWEQKRNYFFNQVAILPGNLGYIDFTNFADTSTLARNTVRAAMQFVAYTDALLLDLRDNGGGNGVMAGEIISYFFNEPTLLGRRYSRLTNTWTESWVINNFAVTHGLYLGMPLFVLTSKRTFSAAEGLAYTLQQLNKATVVGDTTQGGAHLTRSFALANGFVGFIPYSRGEHVLTKTDWEKVGVVPNVVTDERNALTKAQQQYWLTKLRKTKSEEDGKIRWQLNRLQGQASPISIPLALLSQYVGQFEEYVFTIQDSQLVSTNLSRKGKQDKLTALSPTLFQIDRESQVEFIKNSQGEFTQIKLLFDDGWAGILHKK